MADIAQLRERVERDVFDYQQLQLCLAGLRKPRDAIARLVRRGHIVRIRKGLYVFADPFRRAPVSREYLANAIHGPSYISLDYALSHHGLIPERVEEIASVCLGRSRCFRTPFGLFRYQSTSPGRYSVGALLVSSGVDSFLIASPEKALADRVWADRRFSGGTREDFASYLEQDLRVDPERLRSLSRPRLAEVASAYRSAKITALLRYVLSLEERSGA